MTSMVPFVDIKINLNPSGLSMLKNGRKYIIPCQSYFNRQSRDELAQKRYQEIASVVRKSLGDNLTSSTNEYAKQAFKELESTIHDLYNQPLSRKLMKRARREYRIVKSLKKLIRTQSDLIVSRIDKGEGFYLGRKSKMNMKTLDYMNKTEAYEAVPINQCPLLDTFRAMKDLADYFLKNKIVSQAQYNSLIPDPNKLELAYLYALPKIHKSGIPIRPIVSALHAPVNEMSKFLNKLLAPVYLKVARATTFTSSIDVIRKLNTYVTDGHLKPTTKFITADVENLYTMIPREGGLNALIRFLEKYTKQGRIGPFTIDMILKMARLILDTNYFVYNNTYYHQNRGGAMGSAFTQVFANIYMLEWEQDFIEHQHSNGEIYGRYIDDIFMTTNLGDQDLKLLLEQAQKKDVNIRITPTVDSSVHFLDINIMNHEGHIKTSVYHKPSADPYYLPYASDHPHRIHRNIAYSALLRAARLSSNLHEFQIERVRLEVTLLLNSYPPHLITNQFQRFFQTNSVGTLFRHFDNEVYERLHKRLLVSKTKRENLLSESNTDPVTNPPILNGKLWNKQLLIIKLPYESGPLETLPRLFKQWWKKHYDKPGMPTNRIQIKTIQKSDRSLQRFIIKKKPSKDQILDNLLTAM